ncbi:hypothetical protein KHA80_13885 [Anaerobacillus sp. HL2]|nr:hypothetical protein KHA80_13885 [Anaerobacillus sp. HL2]
MNMGKSKCLFFIFYFFSNNNEPLFPPLESEPHAETTAKILAKTNTINNFLVPFLHPLYLFSLGILSKLMEKLLRNSS